MSTAFSLRRLLRKILLAKRRATASYISPLSVDLTKAKLKDPRPFVSIHVALYNEKRVVERLIKACTAQEWFFELKTGNLKQRRANYEVVIVDDSTDETTQIAKQTLLSTDYRLQKEGQSTVYSLQSTAVVSSQNAVDKELEIFVFSKPNAPTVKLIHRSSRSGFKGGALQVALENTDPAAEYITVFDADFVPYPDTIEQFVKTFQVLGRTTDYGLQTTAPPLSGQAVDGRQNAVDNKIAAVQGYQWHVLNKSQTWVTRGVRTEYAGSYVIERASEEIYGGLKQIAGAVYMIRADVLRAFGWGTSITEDFELTLRLYEAGYKVVFSPYIQAPAEAVATIKRLIRQRMRWAEGSSFNIKVMFARMLQSPNMTRAEKMEFIYLSFYYLQAAFFVVGTFAWFISETIFAARLPFWTAPLGWSLVFTNLLALPLMNIVGMFLEESDERDYVGILSFIALSYIVVPFQAYAAIKGFLESAEGPWFRTPKTGVVTDDFSRSGFGKFFGNLFGREEPSVIATSTTKGLDFAFIPPNNFGSSFGSKQMKHRVKWVGRVVVVSMLIFFVTLSFYSFGGNLFEKQPGTNPAPGQTLKVVNDTGETFSSTQAPTFSLPIAKAKKLSHIGRFLTGQDVYAQTPEIIETALYDVNGTEVDIQPQTKELADQYLLTLPQANLKPGRYILSAKWQDREGTIHSENQNFRWGVLAINTNKGIYLSNETARIGFGILSDRGTIVCNAALLLEVKAPDGKQATLSTKDGTIKQSGECGQGNVTYKADYLAEYKTDKIGFYGFRLSAETESGIISIDQSFEVKDSIPFDVERTLYPTRIYPPADSPMTVSVVANEDFEGEVVESLPISFEIKNQNAKVKSSSKNSKVKELVWDVDWKRGEKHELAYTLTAPDTTPAVYMVEPLRFKEVEEPFDQSQGKPKEPEVVFAESVNSAYLIQVPYGASREFVLTKNGTVITRENQRLIFDELPTPIINKAGEVIGVEVMVRLFDGVNEVRIDPHRRIINPPTVPRKNLTYVDDPSGAVDKDGLPVKLRVVGAADPEAAFIEAVWDSVDGVPNAKGWRTQGTVTTVFATAPGGNGRLRSADATYATARTGGTLALFSDHSAGQELVAGVYRIYEGFIIFATSDIPDTDTVSAVVLSLDGDADNSTTDFIAGVAASAYDGGQVVAGDWVSGASIPTPELATWDSSGYVTGYNAFTETASFAGAINKTGDTSLILYSQRHRDATVPPDSEQVRFTDADATGTTIDPKLDITHAADIPEFALALAPFSLFVPKVFKSIQRGTLVEDARNLLFKIYKSAVLFFGRLKASISQVVRRLVRKRRKGKRRQKGRGG